MHHVILQHIVSGKTIETLRPSSRDKKPPRNPFSQYNEATEIGVNQPLPYAKFIGYRNNRAIMGGQRLFVLI